MGIPGPMGPQGPAGGGGGSATTIEQNLGSTPVLRGSFTITDAAIGASSKVLAWQAPGPYTGKGTRADEAEMQPVRVIAVTPAAGSAVVYWRSAEGFTGNNHGSRFLARPVTGVLVGQDSGTWRPSKVIGRVRGNVKFSYMVLA